jgi:hypothetical protein
VVQQRAQGLTIHSSRTRFAGRLNSGVSSHRMLPMRLTFLLLTLLILPFSLRAADPQTDRATLRAKLMEETKLVAVMGIERPSTSFKDDGDPNTLEVVFLSKRSDGPSRVSPDGEVIFLYEPTEDLQSELIGKALDLRVARKIGGS